MRPHILPCDPDASLEIWPDFPETEIASGSRASHGRYVFRDAERGFDVGIWGAEANLGRWMDWPVHEFCLILDGEVVMVEEGRETVIGPGEAFFIPKGRRCIWNQSGYARKIFVIFNSADSAATPDHPIAKIDPAQPLSPADLPPADLLLPPLPQHSAAECFADPTGQFTIGLWETTTYQRKLMDYSRHELMHLISGTVTFTDDRGATQTFGPGETFLVPLGTPNAWSSDGVLRKIYVSLTPNC